MPSIIDGVKRNNELIPEHFRTALLMNADRYSREMGCELSFTDGSPVLTNKRRSVVVRITRYIATSDMVLNSLLQLNEVTLTYFIYLENIFDYRFFRRRLSEMLLQVGMLRAEETQLPSFALPRDLFGILSQEHRLCLDSEFREAFKPSEVYYWFIEQGFKNYLYTIKQGDDVYYFHRCKVVPKN